MNIQRFIAITSREAMAKARNVFGDSAVILSSRATDEGFEVMAAAEESLAPMAATASLMAPGHRIAPIVTRRSGARPGRPPQVDEDDDETVEADTEALAMSTLSFQDYVRERMLRKRRGEAEEGSTDDAPPVQRATPAAPPRVAARPMAARALPQEDRPVAQAPQTPVAAPAQSQRPSVPSPIQTRPAVEANGASAAVSTEQSALAASARTTHVAAELTALKDLMEERFNTLAWLGNTRQNPVQSQLMLKMISAGYSPAMARTVLGRVPANCAATEAQRWVQETIVRNMKASGPGQTLCDVGRVVALIGPTGVGKTTTAAKLAAQCVKQYGAGSVGLITLDTYRVSGYEQLRAYGRMLGVAAHLAHDRAALKDLLSLLSGKRMVIVDTAGLGQRDQRVQDMLEVLDMRGLQKVLVLNAGSHGDTLDDVLTVFKANALHGVVLTKVDEAVKLGPSIDALIRHQVVLRGVANGQRVPEDWQDPDVGALVRMSFGNDTKSAHDPLPSEMGLYFSQASSLGFRMGGAHV